MRSLKLSIQTTLKFSFIIISIIAFINWAWILWITPLYGDDLWHLGVRDTSLWQLLSVPVFGDSNFLPILHLWVWLISFFPVDAPWMHGIQAAFLLLTGWMIYLVMGKMEVESWIRWMAITLLLTTPTLLESIVWTTGTHVWLASLWIIFALIILPDI